MPDLTFVSGTAVANQAVVICSGALLTDAVPEVAQLAITVNGVPRTISSPTIVAGQFVFTFDGAAVAPGDVVLVSYTNPATVVAPTAPGQNYSIPGGATSVTNGTNLQTALSGGTAIDIVLENGTYDKASNFTRGAAHRLYARNFGQAILTAAIDAGSNSIGAGEYYGLKFNVTDALKLAFSSQLVNWGSGSGGQNIVVKDCEFDGGASRVPTYLLRIDRPHGAIVERCKFTNALDYGARISDNNLSSTAVITTINDIDASNIYRATRGNSNGTAETGLWVGHKVTNGVHRVKVRNTGWMGITPICNIEDTEFTDLDLNEIYGVAPDTSIIGTGIYAERVTQNITFNRFVIGPDLFNGINGEWNDSIGGNAAFNTVVAKNGRITTSRVEATVKNRGFYSDSGGRDITVTDVVFKDCEHSCVGVNNDDSGATTIADIHHNDYSQRAADCVRVTWTHHLTFPATEQGSDGTPPRRLLAAAATRDEVTSFTAQPLDVEDPPEEPSLPSGDQQHETTETWGQLMREAKGKDHKPKPRDTTGDIGTDRWLDG